MDVVLAVGETSLITHVFAVSRDDHSSLAARIAPGVFVDKLGYVGLCPLERCRPMTELEWRRLLKRERSVTPWSLGRLYDSKRAVNENRFIRGQRERIA